VKKPTILLVEDTIQLSAVYQEYLINEDARIIPMVSGREVLDYLSEQVPEVILLDMRLPDMDGMDILKHIAEKELKTTVIVVTGHGSISRAVEAMRLGAFEFLLKPFDKNQLVMAVRNALERMQLKQAVDAFKSKEPRTEYYGMVGSSAPMQAVYQTIENVSSSNATVFITGESGTGKELCAHAIHNKSPRRDEEFVVINCGAIPKDLIESEIFGHVKGSFTGAVRDRVGAASKAHKGTLFLDEICEMDIDLQAKLLRFIQSGTFQKVGSSETTTVDIRIVCATNRDPLERVEQGLFREDLYYRLNVIPIHMPPIRERGRDKIEIANMLLEKFSAEEHKSFETFSRDVGEIILAHHWPGNIRQLQNVLRNAIVLNNGRMITRDMLPVSFVRHYEENAKEALVSPINRAELKGLSHEAEENINGHKKIKPLWLSEKETIEEAIRLCDGQVPRAAAYLEINPSTIYRKIKIWQEKEEK